MIMESNTKMQLNSSKADSEPLKEKTRYAVKELESSKVSLKKLEKYLHWIQDRLHRCSNTQEKLGS